MNREEFEILNNYPLWIKVEKTKQRIREYVDYFGEDNVYVSFSGGKDSTVLLHLVRSLYPNIEAVFSDTGLEYPEIKEFVKSTPNVTIVRPKMSFKQVLEKYGYPVVSKEQSYFIYQVRNTKSEKLRNMRLNGSKKGYFKIAKKNLYLLDSPFKIHNKCCDVMKKNPIKSYEKQSKKVPFIGTLAEESKLRKQRYMQVGCNSFEGRISSTPLGFWKEQDVLQYIKENNLSLASVYGDIVEENGFLKTTGESRTGCVFCLYGCQYEKNPNRIQRLQKTHPQLHKYCLEKLGLKEVMEYMGLEHSVNEEEENDKL